MEEGEGTFVYDYIKQELSAAVVIGHQHFLHMPDGEYFCEQTTKAK
jgi:hypothetical protein